ncbi:MAG: hypothetical protein LBM99_02785 [Bacillales bacterium]|jgi:hypothetical protein|nr:hypothetical protein [Bacillales bacterium]
MSEGKKSRFSLKNIIIVAVSVIVVLTITLILTLAPIYKLGKDKTLIVDNITLKSFKDEEDHPRQVTKDDASSYNYQTENILLKRTVYFNMSKTEIRVSETYLIPTYRIVAYNSGTHHYSIEIKYLEVKNTREYHFSASSYSVIVDAVPQTSDI